MSQSISLGVAFGAGLVSFLSPCVLPLVPGYLSFVSGVNLAAVRQAQADGTAIQLPTGPVVINALAFVLGFSAVFVALGASATALGAVLNSNLKLLGQIAGGVLVLFGLHMTGLLPIKALYQERRFHVTNKPLGLLGAFLVGCAFAFGWTPCIGPILGAILTMAATSSQTVSEGTILLTAYSAGLGLPFLLTAVLINRFYAFFDAIKHHFRTIEVGSGVLLMAVGVLIFTGQLSIISAQAEQFFAPLGGLLGK